VSLILDALKKLEREKDAREPGVLVVGSVPWGARARSRLPLVVALMGTALVALVAFALWPRDRAARPVTPPSPPVSSPVPAPTPGLSGVPPLTTPAPVSPPEPRRLVPPAESRPVEASPSEPAQAGDDVPATSPVPSRAGIPGADDLRLNAISQRDGRPVALINDRLVFEGDAFEGVKVLRIGEAEVEVEVRGQRRVLRF
jgi:hypothetical protein